MSALPGDPTFNPLNNHYDVASYKRICAEFGIDPSSDFRFIIGKNHRLGRVNGDMQLDFKYPGWMKFSNEGGDANKGNRVSYIRPDAVAATQCDWFASKTAAGLTQAGLSRINQLIEAFVYCILGVQVNVRSSILGQGGRAKEAQTEFLTLMEDSIRQTDLAQSVQRYQLAVDEAKVRLNLAVCPRAWLMPATMIINTESIVGYNNKLMQAKAGMKLGVNNDVNLGTKKAALQLMDGVVVQKSCCLKAKFTILKKFFSMKFAVIPRITKQKKYLTKRLKKQEIWIFLKFMMKKKQLTKFLKNLKCPSKWWRFSKTTLSMTQPFHLKNTSKMDCVLAKSFVVLNKGRTKATWSNSGNRQKKS